MPDITALFFDIGGVVLTNGWDRTARAQACAEFGLNMEEFNDRHDYVADGFETGRLTLDEYLERTVFYRDRGFSASEFFEFMKSRSQPHEEVIELLAGLARPGRFLMAALNNESAELSDYRVERFGLRRLFQIFLTSSTLGVKKPDLEIFRVSLRLTQRDAEECLFVDDRQLNLECASAMGFQTILFSSGDDLQRRLLDLGVKP